MDEKIRKYRILAGFSQSEVASKINICKQSYCNKENGITDFTKKETGKLSEENYNLLYKYIEDNKGNLNSHYEGLLKNYLDDYKMSEEEITKYNEQKAKEENIGIDVESKSSGDDEKYINKNYVGVDTSNYIDLEDAGIATFGEYSGTGKGTEQDAWVAYVLEMANSGKLNNGDLIDFNYGYNSSANGSTYMYYNGRFYKTNKKAKDANVQGDGYLENGFSDFLKESLYLSPIGIGVKALIKKWFK